MRHFTIRSALLFVFLTSAVLPSKALAQAFGILPQSVRIETRAGSTIQTQLSAVPFTDNAITVEIEHVPSNWTYESTRGISELTPRIDAVLSKRDGDQSGWFTFPDELIIEPGNGSQTINIGIDIPRDASGTYEGDFVIAEKDTGQILRIAYRTKYQIAITDKPSFQLIDVNDVDFSWGDMGLQMSLDVLNVGNAALVVSGKYQLDSVTAGRKKSILIDELTQTPLSAGQASAVEQFMPANIPSGDYVISILPEIDGRRQRPIQVSGRLVNAYEYGQLASETGLSTLPNLIRASVKSGANRNFPLTVRNSGTQSAEISIDQVRWLDDVPENVVVSVTPNRFTLQPGQERVARVQVKSSETYSAAASPRYGLITLATGGQSLNHQVLFELGDTNTSPDRSIRFENARIVADPDDDGRALLRFEIENQGMQAETPHFSLSLSGDEALDALVLEAIQASPYFIGPGLKKTETIPLPEDLNFFQDIVKRNRASVISVSLEPILGGVREGPVRLTAKVAGLDAD